MILQALREMAKREGLLDDPDFVPMPVAWIIEVGEGGAFLGIRSTADGPGTKGRKAAAKKFSIPCRSGRTSGDVADFLVDKSEYVFGVVTEKQAAEEAKKGKARKPAVLKTRRRLFFAHVEAAASATNDPGLIAVRDYLAKLPETVTTADLEKIAPGAAGNDLFAFLYSPDVDMLVHLREKVRAHWSGVRASGNEAAALENWRCVACDARCAPVSKHPLIKKVPGGTPSGVALVSFNVKALESYELDGANNAPTCQRCADAYTRALNRLLDASYPDPRDPGVSLVRGNARLSSDTAAVFWVAGGADTQSFFAAAIDGEAAAVAALYGSPWQGRPIAMDDSSRFHALVLTGGQGRAILRSYFESTVHDAAANLKRHFEDLAIVDDSGVAVSLRRLVEALSVQGREVTPPASLAESLFAIALRGGLYPADVLARAVLRTRAEIGGLGETDRLKQWQSRERLRQRCQLLKAYFNRRRRSAGGVGQEMEVTKDMDSENRNPAYRSGRLFAALERLQGLAIENAGATIADRFYGAASATPASVFGRLLRGARNHASKAKGGRYAGMAVVLERLLDEICAPVLTFPKSLTLEEQGLFALGYYHQRAELWKKRDESGGEKTTKTNG